LNQDLTLFPQEEEEEQPVELFEPNTDQSNAVPRNAIELAAQLSMVDEKDLVMPFSDRLAKHSQNLETHGSSPLVAEWANVEREEKLRAIEFAAQEAARRGDANSVENAVRALAAEKQRQLTPPTDAEGHVALATRALEETGIEYLRRTVKEDAAIADKVEQEGGLLGLRNLLHQKMAEQQGKSGFWDIVGHIGTSMLPFVEPALTTLSLREVGVNSVEDFRTMWLGLKPEEQGLLMDKLIATSDNPSRMAEVLRKIAHETRTERLADMATQLIPIADVAAIATGVARLMSRAAPAVVLKEVAGPQAAAKVVVSDLLNGTKVGGLTDEQLTAKLLSIGGNPMDMGMGEGMSAAAQAELRSNWNTMLDEAHSVINSTVMTPAERAAGHARIRQNYLKNTDPSIHSFVFGDADDVGQRTTVYRQRDDGTSFVSPESARDKAIADGRVNFRIVPESEARPSMTIKTAQTLHHGSVDLFEEVAPHFVGRNGAALGHGFYATAIETIAKRIAAGRATKEGAEKGFTYKVSVPDEHLFMDWNKPLSKQSPEVQQMLRAVEDTQGLVFKPKQTGEQIYRQLSRKLGGDKNASQLLDEAGVKGNVVREKGIYGDEQHVIFNTKNVKLVERGEVPRNPVDEAFEQEAQEADDWFLENVKMAYGDVLQQADHDLDMFRLAAKAGTPNKDAKGAISRGDPLFQKGRSIEFGDSIHPRYQALVKDWVEMLGMKGERLIMVSEDEVFRASVAMGHRASYTQKSYTLIKSGQAQGTHATFPDGTHLIVVASNNVKFRDWIGVASHEMGHMFDVAILSRAPLAVIKEMKAEFQAFISGSRGKSAAEFMAKFRIPVPRNLKFIAETQANDFTIGGGNLGWYEDFSEWYAENFAKFMMTDAKPLSVMEKWFYEKAQLLKAFFQKLAKVMGMDTSEAATSVRSFMQRYLDDPRSIEWREKANSIFGTESQLATSAAPKRTSKVAGKPHIKGPVATAHPTEGWLIAEEVVDPIPMGSLGKFEAGDIESMPFIALDPKHQASELGVEARVIGIHAEAKLRKELMKGVTPFMDRLGKASKAKVEAILEEGDSFSNPGGVAKGKEFNYGELQARGFTEQEAQAYFAVRQVRMMSWHLRNGDSVRHLKSQGFREVELLGTGEKHAGRMLDEAQAGSAALGRTVFDTVTGERVLMDSEKLSAAYAGGKRVVQLKAPVDMADKKAYSTILVDDSTAKVRDITVAVPYRPGEYARIYSDEYFVRVKKMKEVDGVMKEVTETVRTARSVREAEEFVQAHRAAIRLLLDEKAGGVPRNAEVEQLVGRYTDPAELRAQLDAGELDGYVDMDWHYTRNKEDYLNGSISEAITNGRLFTSKRGQRLFSVEADRQNTLTPFQSIEAEISNISRVVNINQWRESMIQKWMNTFGDMLPHRTGDDVADFIAHAGNKFTRTTKEAQFANRTHHYIMRQIGLKTDEENAAIALTRQVTEGLLKGGETIETVGAAIRQARFLDNLRSFNFNMMLGMWNPAQLLVQANGMASAVILSPLHGLAAAKTFPLLRMALSSDRPEVWSKLATLQKFSDLGLSDKEEFVKLVQAVRKTGIIDNIRSTALWNKEGGKLNVFNGYSHRHGYGQGFFFNRGEEASRLISFDVARREWIAANPGKAWDTNDALRAMVTRMDDLTMNMTRANLARWQEGAISIPLQFTQYMVKFANNTIGGLFYGGKGRGFSRKESAQLLLGHVLLYGALGNGLMTLADEVLGDAAQEMSPETKNAIGQGIVGWAFDAMHQAATGEGAKVALATRFGVGEYWVELARKAYNGDSTLWSTVMGPTYGTMDRLGTIGEVVGLWIKNPDLTGQDVAEGLATMGLEQVSSLRNATKAYLYYQHQGKVISASSGTKMAEVNMNEMLWQALGFSPLVQQDVFRLIQSKKHHNEAMDDLAKQILRTQRELIGALQRNDMELAGRKKKLLQALFPDNAGDMFDVQRRVRERLAPHDTEFQKLLGEYMFQGNRDKPFVMTEQPRKK
jgi:hypothetical protein